MTAVDEPAVAERARTDDLKMVARGGSLNFIGAVANGLFQFALVVVVNGTASTIPFQQESALTVFQNDMEELLIHTGWQLQECQPERRQKRDRRRFPRVTNDRRRWWTDPAPADKVYVPTRGDRRTNKYRAEKD